MRHCAAVTRHQYAAHHSAQPLSPQWPVVPEWWPVVAGIISIHIVIVPLPILGHLSTPDTRYTATAASGRAFQICGIKSVYLSKNTAL